MPFQFDSRITYPLDVWKDKFCSLPTFGQKVKIDPQSEYGPENPGEYYLVGFTINKFGVNIELSPSLEKIDIIDGWNVEHLIPACEFPEIRAAQSPETVFAACSLRVHYDIGREENWPVEDGKTWNQVVAERANGVTQAILQQKVCADIETGGDKTVMSTVDYMALQLMERIIKEGYEHPAVYLSDDIVAAKIYGIAKDTAGWLN